MPIPHDIDRRAGFYAAKLDALRNEARLVRRQLDRTPDDGRRALLARLDAADTRAADFFARLIEKARAAA